MGLSNVLGKVVKTAAKAGNTVKKVAPKVVKKSKSEIRAGVLPKNPTGKQIAKDLKKSQPSGIPSKRSTYAKAGAAALGAGAVYNLGNNLGGGSSSSRTGKVMSHSGAHAGAWDTGKHGTGRTGAAKPSSSSGSRHSGLSKAGGSYTAAHGDSLWSIAEKTVPKGKSVTSWWLAIKKMNTVNGKVRRLYSGTGVSLPPGARRS